MLVRSDRIALLASPVFMAALALLVLNDFALKPLLHNALTGKLSDLAGVFALTLFVVTLWPRHRRLSAWAIAAAFTFWKTSYAEPLLDWLNAISPFPFGRTVDVTDLVALPTIPLAVWAAPRLAPLPLSRVLQWVLVVVALVAFTATSRARYVSRSTLDATQAVAVDEPGLHRLFDEIADERALKCAVCVPLAEGRVYVAQQDGDVRALIVDLDAPQTLSITVSGYDRKRGVRSLTRDIRGRLAEEFPGLVVVDTTTDLGAVAEGATTIFVIRGQSTETTKDAEESLASIVASVAREHGLALDSSVYRASTNDFTLGPISDRDDVLRVRLGRRSPSAEALHRTIAGDLAMRLGAEFGAENVARHDVSAAPAEWVY
jgi:hypothetical protein